MRKIKFAEGEFYHIYNRGVDKRTVFLDQNDYERFLSSLLLSNSKKHFNIEKRNRKTKSFDFQSLVERGDPVVAIGAYCLMPNHFHLLVKEITPGGISVFMQKLQTGYTGFFNKKNQRTGALFEGTFKAEHVDTDMYLKYLYTYIHLNPIGIIDKGWKQKKIEDKDKAKKFLEGYTFSSFFDYQEKERVEKLILSKEDFPEYFKNSAEFNLMIKEWINFSGEILG